jgi:hypothetical protein
MADFQQHLAIQNSMRQAQSSEGDGPRSSATISGDSVGGGEEGGPLRNLPKLGGNLDDSIRSNISGSLADLGLGGNVEDLFRISNPALGSNILDAVEHHGPFKVATGDRSIMNFAGSTKLEHTAVGEQLNAGTPSGKSRDSQGQSH